jgi:Velvet factor
VYCSLWNPWTDEEDNIIPTTSKLPQRRLIGTLVGSHFYGKDNLDREQCFFYFADLSVRSAGTYCLRFELVVLDAWRMVTRSSLAVAATVKSNVFTVHNAKDFQGMRPSTELTRCLRAQGCLIPAKKGNANANTSSSPEEIVMIERDGESGSSVVDESRSLPERIRHC